MYCNYFGLREYPFLSTADRRFFYLSEGQSQAKSYLQYLLEIRDGIVVLIGEPGAGKTVLLDQLLRDLPSKVVCARVTHTLVNDEEFLLSVCMQLGCVPADKNRPALFSALHQFVMDQHLAMNPVLLAVDEAHSLSPRVLEEIRQLANLEMFGRKLVQFVLMGQPELQGIVSDLPNDALAQLIRLTHLLQPLNRHELIEYIDYRLYVAGNDGRIVFPNEIMDEMLRYTGGIPRLVNQLCDMMLVICFVNKLNVIDLRILRGAVKRLGWPQYHERKREPVRVNHDVVDMRPLPLIVVRNGDDIVGKYLLNKKRMLIGRHPNMEIVIDEPAAGGFHAQLVNLDKQFFIHDLNHNNDTLLDGKPVKWHVLADRDILRIGNHTLEYQLSEEAEAVIGELETAAIA